MLFAAVYIIIEKTGKLSVNRSIIRKDSRDHGEYEARKGRNERECKNNLNAFREELEYFDAIELRLTEHAENNQKSMEKMEEDQE